MKLHHSVLACVCLAICTAACTFQPWNGVECQGLHQAAAATDPTQCAAACCGNSTCQTWQWCQPGYSCQPANSCWIGLTAGGCTQRPGWLGGLASGDAYSISLPSNQPAPVVIPPMGPNKSPSGDVLTCDSTSFRLNGEPWMPVMGEMQFERIPANEWMNGLLRMRESGINVVGTYVFWIHHAEINNETWSWSGSNNLTAFVTMADQLGLKVFLRLGPYVHAESRNGGMPDWLLAVPGIQIRSTQPLFMSYVEGWYGQLAQQLTGLYWGLGGPVIGMQMDNEYGGSYTYLQALKELAINLGMTVPFYTKTGWPVESQPTNMLLPYVGQYADDFWDRTLTPAIASSAAFNFAQLSSADSFLEGYPILSVELGGGMETSYHRRIRINSIDVSSESVVQVGNGMNSLGYYIYHGATQVTGQLSSMEECQIAGGYNDLPVKGYDFFAAISQYGTSHPHYHTMRCFHLFVNTWGDWLVMQPTQLPLIMPSGDTDNTTLRWAVRSNGTTGALFLNNHQRYITVPAFENVQFTLNLSDGSQIVFPSSPVTIQVDTYGLFPFNWEVVPGFFLQCTTVQPIAMTGPSDSPAVAFMSLAGIPAEMVIIHVPGLSVNTCNANCTTIANGNVLVTDIRGDGMTPFLSLAADNNKVDFYLLDSDADQAISFWKVGLGIKDYFVLADGADAVVAEAENQLRVTLSSTTDTSIAFYPPPASVSVDGKTLSPTPNGTYAQYTIPGAAPIAVANWSLIQAAGPARKVPIGSAGVAQAPDEDGNEVDYAAAAVYQVEILPLNASGPWPPGTASLINYNLQVDINYTADCARVYVTNGTAGQYNVLVSDNFYNGRVYTLGLNRYAPLIFAPLAQGGGFQLKILPLSQDAPIFLDPWPVFPGNASTVLSLDSIDVIQYVDTHIDVVVATD